MKIKVSTATKATLDWLVAKCEAVCLETDAFGLAPIIASPAFTRRFKPSTNWAQGGPIIEREKIDIFHQDNGFSGAIEMATRKNPHPTPYYGETDLVAAMRTYVASKLGEEVDVPEELT